MVGLGGKTSTTGRGTLKDLVRKPGTAALRGDSTGWPQLKTGVRLPLDAQTATIEITLHNRGAEAFNPTELGDEITIKRFINKTGASRYSIRNANGTEWSTRKSDLDTILDSFNIQVRRGRCPSPVACLCFGSHEGPPWVKVDNPVSVLTQETSKTFLKNGKPADFYNLFERATHLQQMRLNYDVRARVYMCEGDMGGKCGYGWGCIWLFIPPNTDTT